MKFCVSSNNKEEIGSRRAEEGGELGCAHSPSRALLGANGWNSLRYSALNGYVRCQNYRGGGSPQLINWVCKVFGDLQMEGAKQSENYHNFCLSEIIKRCCFHHSLETQVLLLFASPLQNQLNSCRCICYSGGFTGLNNFQMEFLGSSFDFPFIISYSGCVTGHTKQCVAVSSCCLNGRKFISWGNNE